MSVALFGHAEHMEAAEAGSQMSAMGGSWWVALMGPPWSNGYLASQCIMDCKGIFVQPSVQIL